MRTVRRLFYVDIVSAVVFVALAFLALFSVSYTHLTLPTILRV